MIEYKSSQKMEFKTFHVELVLKGEGDKPSVKGYGCAFNNVDSWGDIILPGACDAFLASEDKSRTRFCWQHDITSIIGKFTDMSVDEKGLLFEAELIDTIYGKEAQEVIRTGALNEFSIGYWAKRYHYEKRDGYEYDIRVLDEIAIAEISLVSRAANPEAVITESSVKSDPDTADTTNEKKNIELNTMEEELKQQLADLQAKTDAASKAGEAVEGIKKDIEALDASAKEQKTALEALKASLESKTPKTFAQAIKSALEELKTKMDGNKTAGRFTVEVKASDPAAMGTANINPNIVLGVQVDPAVHAAPVQPNAAIAALGVAVSEGNKLQWVEATRNEVVGYVAELASNTNLSDYSFAEKTRKFGKLVTKIELSTEVQDWFGILSDWAINEARRAVENKFDDELFNGDGADSTNENEVYGLIGAATAFSAPYTVKFASIADAILAAAHQAAANGYNPDTVFLTYAEYGALKSLKDENGRYIFDDVTRQLQNLRVFPTTHLASGELIVLDSSCYRPYAGNSYEIEAVRDADADKTKFYFRKRCQAKYTTPGKLGIIYIEDIEDAIEALNQASTLDGIATSVAAVATSAAAIATSSGKTATAAEGLNADSKVFKTKEQQ